MSDPRPLRLYESNIPSGNVYKVQLLAHHLGLTLEIETLDILVQPAETRRPDFLRKNANGRVPLLELEDGTFLPESNAILYYLSANTAYFPDEKLAQAQVLQWLFFEQYSHEPYVAVLKFWTFWGGLHRKSQGELAVLKERGQAALQVMELHLAERKFFVGETLSIADIALYAYTHTASLCGFELGEHTSRWLERVAAQPRHIPIGTGPGSPGFAVK